MSQISETSVALQTFHLHKHFGGIHATDDVSLSIERGARHALIGPNGAGKTTLINLLTGVLTPTSGRIELGGEDITRLPVHQRARRGLVRTFQINQLFAELTPLQTVAIAVAERKRHGFGMWRPLDRDAGVMEEAAALLQQFHLGDVMREKTSALPYGKRRLLEITIALAAQPRVLLLDEPVAGVPDSDRHEILDTVARLPNDVTVLLIEHDMDLVFSFAKRISVLVNGALFVDGATADVARDPRVRAVYLGEDVTHV
jgi:branched-chain amino acid transport system ATP-binding protein